MTENVAAIFADMQVPVIPTVGRDVCRHIPTAAAQIADKNLAAGEAAGERRQAAGKNVLLVAMDDVGSADFREQRRGDGIGALTAHIGGGAEHVHRQITQLLGPSVVAESREQSGHFGRHVLSQFQRVTFGATHHAIFAEYGGRYMQNTHEQSMGFIWASLQWRECYRCIEDP